VKFSKARPAVNGKPHIAIAQRFGFIRKAVVTHGARHDGSQLREVVTTNNTASDVWADTAYRSKANEAWLKANGQDHARQPRLQYEPSDLLGTTGSHRISVSGAADRSRIQ
jgi:transposase, IS5 family